MLFQCETVNHRFLGIYLSCHQTKIAQNTLQKIQTNIVKSITWLFFTIYNLLFAVYFLFFLFLFQTGAKIGANDTKIFNVFSVEIWTFPNGGEPMDILSVIN